MSIESAHAFIRSVDLGAPAVHAIALPEALSFVVRGTLVAFDEHTPSEQKKDALYAILFAQLAADAQKDKYTEFDAWYSLYSVTLGKIGWALGKASTSQGQVQGVVKDFALEQLKKNVSGDELTALNRGLQAIYSAGITGEATTILGRATAQPHTGVTELGVVKADKSLDVTLFTQTLFYASPKTLVTSAFFVNIPEAVPITLNTRQDTLSKRAADTVRTTLYERVDPFVADNIRAVEPVN